MVTFIYFASLAQKMSLSHIRRNKPNQRRSLNSEFWFYHLVLPLNLMNVVNTSYTEVGRGVWWWYGVEVGWCRI